MRGLWFPRLWLGAIPSVLLTTAVHASAPPSQQSGTAETVKLPEAIAATQPVTNGAGAPSPVELPRCASGSIPALTPVSVEILEPLGSKISHTGQTFAFRLSAPINLEGCEAIPAGTNGQGEVVHAKKSSGMGAAGELVLAARYLDLGDRRLRLRSLRFASAGKSNIDKVNTLVVASAASPLPVELLGFFITGGQVSVPQGTIAEAKTAEPFEIAVGSATTAAIQPPTSQGETKP